MRRTLPRSLSRPRLSGRPSAREAPLAGPAGEVERAARCRPGLRAGGNAVGAAASEALPVGPRRRGCPPGPARLAAPAVGTLDGQDWS